jgi:CHAT domain-containing protein
MPDPPSAGLGRLQAALDSGDLAAARAALLELDARERDLLAAEMGGAPLGRAMSAARGAVRAEKQGRVVVVHGILGSLLDSVDISGAADRVWLNLLRLAAGRFGDLELGPDGKPGGEGRPVRTAGLHRKTYLPLLLELDRRWDVRPFAFDWREDVDRSAMRLDAEVREWAGGEPVHIVAHSMGGLVSRRMIQLAPETWAAIDDGDGRRRGGRLVMLGTPNRGAFVIPLLLQGQERTLKMLAAVDLRHDQRELLAIIATFPGVYQMLPSPLRELGDDHGALFEAGPWGDLPVRAELLARARALHEALDEVRSPERLVYVAGYDRATPFRVRVESPGRFSYQETTDGDGRVPHELGLLDGVATFWAPDAHGDLPKGQGVLDGIHDLLATGTTAALRATKPERRAAPAATAWRPAAEVDHVPAIAMAPAARGGAAPPLDEMARIRLEDEMAGDYLGRGDPTPVPAPAGPEAAPVPAPAPPAAPPELPVEVVWGDIGLAEGDVYAVGHYEGVVPQRAEAALDLKVSAGRRPGVIAEQTRRGLVRGELGEISLFPWGERAHRGRVVAVAGMGRPGTFDGQRLVRLVRNLTWVVNGLPGHSTLCTVLIGSGEGTLSTREAVRGLVSGLAEALEGGGERGGVERLRIVERDRDRAEDIQAALLPEAAAAEAAGRIRLRVAEAVRPGLGRRISAPDALTLLLSSAVLAAGEGEDDPARRGVAALAERLPFGVELEGAVWDALAQLGGAGADLTAIAARLDLRFSQPEAPRPDVPARLAFTQDGESIRTAAITDTATVAERALRTDARLVDEIIQDTTDPQAGEVPELAALLTRVLLPREFREILGAERPLVFEVDRAMARVHWEMVADLDPGASPQPIAVRRPVARQLRTAYSPAPAPARVEAGPIRALVIGDPDDAHPLPGARAEAEAVIRLLRERGVEVTALVGAPGDPPDRRPPDSEPARRLRALQLLVAGGFHLVHYAGHGSFDEQEPDRAGWLFSGGLLTSRELESVDVAPALVVANACLSGLVAPGAPADGAPRDAAREAARLVPGLADEFFNRGVRDYVGTAWEVDDAGAILFATTLYESLLPLPGSAASSVGEAVRLARLALWDQRARFGSLWAAYQHYGDPTPTVRPLAPREAGA